MSLSYRDWDSDTSHAIAKSVANHETHCVLGGWQLETAAVPHAAIPDLLQAFGSEMDVDTL